MTRPRLDVADPSRNPMTDGREIAPNFYTASCLPGWNAACRWESERTGGQWWPRERGLTHVMGRVVTWIVTPDQVAAIMAARAVCEGLGLVCGYSIGSAARALLRFIGPGQYPYRRCVRLIEETGHAYLECHPGIYPDAVLYDARSYYYTLLCRLPSWRLTIGANDRLHLHGNWPGEEDRRQLVLGLVEPHKLLRNALVGCMCGREAGSPYWYRGKRYTHRGGPGIFRGAGWLVRRTAWELVRRAAEETDSKLSNTDCVLATGGLYPEVWDRYGIGVRSVHEGDAEVCAPTIYRVGSHETVFYRQGSRFSDTMARPPLPSIEYADAWLRCVA